MKTSRKKVYVLLAPGFEEIEAITSIDILRRSGLEVVCAAVSGKRLVRASRRVNVQADVLIKNLRGVPDAVVLPGGMPGAKNLGESPAVARLVKKCLAKGKIVAAICAAPVQALAKFGVLSGKRATGYPDPEGRAKYPDIKWSDFDVVKDKNIITSRGPGTAMQFALKVAGELAGKKTARVVKEKALVK